MEPTTMARINIFFIGSREELDRIEARFTWLKGITGINKIGLYKRALLWIAEDENVMQKFIEYLLGEKELVQTQIVKIKE